MTVLTCVITDQPLASCEHCNDPEYIHVEYSDFQYETLFPAFRTQFKGVCTVEPRHTIKKGDLVAKVQRADNPGLIITGVACKNCTLMLPRARLT